ncbi:hypothetical protein ACL6C3_04645 [Capilliphycus salinus ALCB114379]|uniref:hypothetical protein n=1 Tax=Capilliphycus salinus TaxID=2768948 RepID=UPI0039A5CD11
MLGTFQQSNLRIEVEASEVTIRESLLRPNQLQKWLWPQQFSPGLPEQFHTGMSFTSSIGPVTIRHYVDVAESNCLRFLLSGGIDGFHEWYWGEGWIQSRLEGFSVLPLNLGQTVNLMRFKEFLSEQNQVKVAS